MYKLLIISFAFLLTVACTKQRDSQFAQGQGENLLSVSSYDGKTFEIKTGAAIEGKKQAFSKAQQLEIKSKAVGENSFSVVSYEVTDSLAKTLLGDTAIVGKENTTYQGLIKVEQNYVKVYKVAKAADLPLSETTYAIKLGEDKLAVPLIGYPITSRVSIDRSKNEYNEKGSTKIEKSEVNISAASHFRIDMSRGEIFEPVQKTDVLPSSLFEGEWFYTETVTAAPEEKSSNLGFTGGYDQTLTPSTRIKFLNNETSLKVVNMNIDERLVKTADVNYKTALTIPVAWKSYKVTSNGQGMAEQEDGKIHWSKRPFLQLDFDKVESGADKAESEYYGTTSNSSKRLVSLEVKDDYISFSLEDGNNGRTRYSFLKVGKRTYAPRRLFKDDKRIFGYFATQKAMVKNYEVSREEDIQKNTFISRFNPRGGKIVFNFTKTTPQWIRPSVKEAVKHWDDAFKAAGVKDLEIVLDETQDVELGDLRFNAINIIENLTSSNLFGFGPSVTDPFTGEIISATTNVHLTPIREALISELKNYIKMKLGLLKEGRSVGVSSLLMTMENTVIKQTEKGLSVVSDYFPTAKGIKMYLPDQKDPNKYTLQKVDFRNRRKGNAAEFDIAIASGNIHAEIEKQCSEVLAYVEDIKKQNVTHNDQENSVLDSCSRKLVLGKFLGTLVHEMGHNFGLRHNFMASNDSANFMSASDTDTKVQVRSSSVMEYSSFNEDRLVKPGPYDIAAIRFGYADSVLLSNGDVTPLDTKQTIAQNLQTKKSPLHSYKYCTDEDVSISTDPMCERHDAGVTPLEVVKNIIADYQSHVEVYNFRGDSLRAIAPAGLMLYRVDRFFKPLGRFYEEWRTGVARFVGEDNQYLENLSPQEFQAIIVKMAADPKYTTFVKQYEPVSKAIFNFFYQVATMENRYCVLAKADGSGIVLNELEKVRQQTYFNKGQSITSCAQASESGFWKDKGMSLMTEVGHNLNSFRFDLSDKAASEPLDVIGTYGDRMTATMALGGRSAQGYDARFRSFAPSLLDEPQFRAVIQNYMLARTINGVPGSYISRYLPLGNPNLTEEARTKLTSIKEFMDKSNYPMYSTEKDLITTMYASFIMGASIPGKTVVTHERTQFLTGIMVPSSQKAALAQMIASADLGGAYFAVVNKEAQGAIALVETYNNLKSLKDIKLIDTSNAEIQALIKSITPALPTEAELKKMTTQQMIDKLAPLSQAIQKALDKKNPTIELLVGKIAAVHGLAAQVAEGLKDPNPETVAGIKGVLAAPFMAFAQKQMAIVSFPTVETFEKDIQEQNDSFNYYKENRAELDSQAEVIRQALQVLISG
jgi:hypothetical protein